MPPPSVAALTGMSTAQLRRAYADAFGESTRSGNRGWLVRRLAWRLQANQTGAALGDAARARAAELAPPDFRLIPPRDQPGPTAAADPGRTVPVPVRDPRLPPPGGVVARRYKGRTVAVTVRADGFEYDGRLYPSLSAVAKAVSGSHCNGFRFFRLGGAA